MSVDKIIHEIMNEIVRQRQLHPKDDHPSVVVGIHPSFQCAQYGMPSEADAKVRCDGATEQNRLTWAHIAVEELAEVIEAPTREDMREELIQLIAVLVSWVKCIDGRVPWTDDFPDKICKKCWANSTPAAHWGCDHHNDPDCNWHISKDAVNHPNHYGGENNHTRLLSLSRQWDTGEGSVIGNAIKYIMRAEHKGNELEDLKKSRWYLNRRIKQLEANQ